MASANLDLVRTIYAGWERGEYGSAEWADPEIEFEIADPPAAGRWTGRERMAEVWADWLRSWEEWQVRADDYRELDHERVLVLNDFAGRGKASGLDLGQMRARGAALFHVRGGKVTRLVLYADSERALADAGLAPETGAPMDRD